LWPEQWEEPPELQLPRQRRPQGWREKAEAHALYISGLPDGVCALAGDWVTDGEIDSANDMSSDSSDDAEGGGGGGGGDDGGGGGSSSSIRHQHGNGSGSIRQLPTRGTGSRFMH
jgi:hypothetical protein